MAGTVNILHLSDLHFGVENASPTKGLSSYAIAQRAQTLDKMVDTIKRNIEEGYLLRPDILVITGDIAWSGKENEYSAAKIWIDKLLDSLGKPLIDIVICPGNHDYDRQYGVSLRNISTIQESISLLSEPNEIFLRPFKEYSAFCKSLKIPHYKYLGKDVDHYLFGETEVKGVRFVILNSAWNTSAEGKKGTLWLGEPQLMKMNLPSIEDNPDLLITLFHHPAEWLADLDHYRYYESCSVPAFTHVTRVSHIILNGHTHGMITAPDVVSQRSMVFTGGATYGRQNYWNSFELLQIGNESRHVSQNVFVYNPADAQWEAKSERTYYPSFLIPQRRKKGSPNATDEVIEPRLGYFPSRGVLENPKDGKRNIAFRVDTFNRIFYEMSVQLEKMEIETEDINELIFRCGLSCGKYFGQEIRKQWEKEATDKGYELPTFTQMVSRWCEFDSSMGFGRLTPVFDQNTKQIRSFAIRESIPPNAGAISQSNGKPCEFMRGYCTGVLEAISSDNIHVILVCDQDQCMLKDDSNVYVCVFSFSSEQNNR